MEQLTLGQKRIRTGFNPSKEDSISVVKQKFATLIDDLETLRKFYLNRTEEEKEKFDMGEQMRLIATAQTKIEEAAMWTIKSMTV